MRITIFTPYLYPFYGDMVSVMNGKVEAKLFTCGIYGNYPFKDLLKYAEVLKCIDTPGGKTLTFTSIIRFLRFRPHGVIIFGIESLGGLIIYFVSKLIRARTLVIIEENNETIVNGIILNLLKKLKRAIKKWVYKSADILVAESLASKNYVLKILQVDRKKPIFVRPHGVNVKRFSMFSSMSSYEAKWHIIKKLNLPNNLADKMWISFIGELSYCKGADVLIDAITILVLKKSVCLSKCTFLLPKSYILRDRIDLKRIYIQKLSELLKNNIVVLYPLMKYDLIPIFYRASDIVVLPSRFLKHISSDRSPNVALEALASGCLLVASRTGGIPDIVGDAGILIKPNDPYILAETLEDVIRNYESYKHLKEKAYKRAIEYLDIRLYTLFLLKSLLNLFKDRYNNPVKLYQLIENQSP